VRARAFWQLTTFLLNGALFVLVGLQLHPVVAGHPPSAVVAGFAAAALVSLVVVVTRLVWGNLATYAIRALDRRPVQRLRRVGFRQRQPLAWAGFRGAVSLAAALAIPLQAAGGAPLAGRDLVLIVTIGVIAFTLVVQGLTLPAVIRWARLADDGRDGQERRLAERAATEAAMGAIDERAVQLGIPAEVAERVRSQYADHLHELELREVVLDTLTEHDGERAALEGIAAERALRLALLADKRRAVHALRHQHTIDDLVHQRVQAQLDAEEVRLAGVPDED
jgi:monovalent cation/hydrogen antiporter